MTIFNSSASGGSGSVSGSSSTTVGSIRLLSAVDRRLIDVRVSLSSKLSVLPCMLRGGVRGDCLCGRSVGRKTAGTYMGDFRARWRVANGRFGNIEELRGDVGEVSMGVPEAELRGEYGCAPWWCMGESCGMLYCAVVAIAGEWNWEDSQQRGSEAAQLSKRLLLLQEGGMRRTMSCSRCGWRIHARM